MDRERLVESVRLKFTSANGVPVERAQITRAELEAVIAAEREACARIADEEGKGWHDECAQMACLDVETRIRERSAEGGD